MQHALGPIEKDEREVPIHDPLSRLIVDRLTD